VRDRPRLSNLRGSRRAILRKKEKPERQARTCSDPFSFGIVSPFCVRTVGCGSERLARPIASPPSWTETRGPGFVHVIDGIDEIAIPDARAKPAHRTPSPTSMENPEMP